MSNADDLRIRVMRPDEMAIAADWAAAEGWNPGLADGACFATVDAGGFLIGELDGQISPRARRIADTFTRAGLATTVSDNIMGTIWDKLLINVSTGALSAITRLTYGHLYQVPEVEATALAAVAEAMFFPRIQISPELAFSRPTSVRDRKSVV